MTHHETTETAPVSRPEGQEPILQARGIVKRYGHVTAIDGADFELYPGEILAVIASRLSVWPAFGSPVLVRATSSSAAMP